ncbi:hypothetical protein JYU34_009252 [Plutella xylostella]|uniref:Transmembrane protein 129 n=2 Tax=Plutella xylostella TaxID=51655 RepID=A0ABQ7QMM9_PLUXY|nr:E3 ubiquitin-protein ligase TM129 [Plutella xylostella]KAG7305213.1 hypothetical protein JYU34_009252 [Plutella xylostella]
MYTMDVLITLFYILFCICVIYPPTEFVSAGFTIPLMFENWLGSENVNFVGYHMKRITLTLFLHSALPLGYIFFLWVGGVTNPWMMACTYLAAIIPLLMSLKLMTWWEKEKQDNPIVKMLKPFVPEGGDWRIVAANLNIEFRNVDKVTVHLGTNSKLVTTETWIIKVCLYSIHAIKQSDCTLVATSTDSHNLTPAGEDEIQFITIEVIPNRPDLKQFSFRISAAALRDLQPRLLHPVRVPDHLTLQPTLIERFVMVFKQHVDENPIYYVDQELELCIGCMQSPADVKLSKRCDANTVPVLEGQPQCQQCNCRVLWCCLCIARWWAARAGGAGSAPAAWLEGRCSCPVCRAVFCVRDVCPARARAS